MRHLSRCISFSTLFSPEVCVLDESRSCQVDSPCSASERRINWSGRQNRQARFEPMTGMKPWSKLGVTTNLREEAGLAEGGDKISLEE